MMGSQDGPALEPGRIGELEQALLSSDRLAASEVIERLRSTVEPLELLEKVLVPVLENIGDGWQQGTVSLSQVYMSGRICEQLVDTLLPPSDRQHQREPAMAIAVFEDYHLLGRRVVYSLLRATGHELLDYGRVGLDELVRRVEQDEIELLLLSTLMLPSALRVKQLRSRLDVTHRHVKIIVGGAPFRFDDQLWKEVGADAGCADASQVIETIARVSRASS